MAVCEIWDVRGRLDCPLRYAANPDKTNNPKYTETEWQSLSDVMKYATNGDKTERQFFVSGINCDPSTAREEMQIVKRQFQDESEIVCYHGFQSFREGEVTPEQAHEIGVKLAKKMWGDRFQVIDEIYLMFQNEYSANFLHTLWKRVRKYGAFCTGITQNVEDLLQSHTARTMLSNSELLVMLNQSGNDMDRLAELLNISNTQRSFMENVGPGQGLLKVGSSLVPFVNQFPTNTSLYKLMSTKINE